MLTIVDAEQTIRTWARSSAAANTKAAVDGRVFFATPNDYDPPPKGKGPPASWIVMRLLTEVHEPDDLGLQRASVEFACWGKTKALAGSTAVAVQQDGRSFLGQPVVVGSTVIVMADVLYKMWHPDPVTNLPRYIVDLFFDMRGAEAA